MWTKRLVGLIFSQSRIDVVFPKLRKNKERILMVYYHQALVDVHRVFRELQSLDDFSKVLKKFLPVAPKVSLRRPKNLKDLSVRIKIRPLKKKVWGVFG